MKSGGADVHILDRRPSNPEGEEWRGTIVTQAKTVASYATNENPLAGYVVIGIYKDGSSSIGWRYDPDTANVPRALLPHWVAELIRRDIITHGEAQDTFNQMFEWRE